MARVRDPSTNQDLHFWSAVWAAAVPASAHAGPNLGQKAKTRIIHDKLRQEILWDILAQSSGHENRNALRLIPKWGCGLYWYFALNGYKIDSPQEVASTQARHKSTGHAVHKVVPVRSTTNRLRADPNQKQMTANRKDASFRWPPFVNYARLRFPGFLIIFCCCSFYRVSVPLWSSRHRGY